MEFLGFSDDPAPVEVPEAPFTLDESESEMVVPVVVVEDRSVDDRVEFEPWYTE